MTGRADVWQESAECSKCSGADSEGRDEGLSLGASWQQELAIAASQPCIIAVQQSSDECAPVIDKQASAGVEVQKSTRSSIRSALFLPTVMIRASFRINNSLSLDSDLYHYPWYETPLSSHWSRLMRISLGS